MCAIAQWSSFTNVSTVLVDPCGPSCQTGELYHWWLFPSPCWGHPSSQWVIHIYEVWSWDISFWAYQGRWCRYLHFYHDKGCDIWYIRERHSNGEMLWSNRKDGCIPRKVWTVTDTVLQACSTVNCCKYKVYWPAIMLRSIKGVCQVPAM